MSIISTLSDAAKTLSGNTNLYHLDVHGCDIYLDVKSFSGRESVSAGYHYRIEFNSTEQDINPQQILNHSAILKIQGKNESLTPQIVQKEQKIVHGVITNFIRNSGSVDEAHYQITIEPFFSLLDKQKRSYRFFLNLSVPEVIEQILQDHSFKSWEFDFQLKKTYPKRAQINQINESDREFIERLLSEVGIFYTFIIQPDTKTEVIQFGDKQSCYIFSKNLPLRNPSGTNDNGINSVWGLSLHSQITESSVQVKDYNYRNSKDPLLSGKIDIMHGKNDGITYGDVYQYQPRHLTGGNLLTPETETANFWARLEHERYLTAQTQLQGSSTDPTLALLHVLTVTDNNFPSSLPSVWQSQVIIVGLRFSASRSTALSVTFSAVPYSETLCWRPALKPRPVISGTLTARITSPKNNDIYAHQDKDGHYWVKFDADLEDKRQGFESMPVRLAKPYGGDTYGIHFPLIQGTEVAIAFHEGDPDRPYIAHVLHDSHHPDHVTEQNNTRNIIRTPANNKLRFEDKRDEEHVKLSTEYGGKTQLNMGHLVDANRGLRGQGFELRTDDWGVIRGAKGILLTADAQPGANGQILEMDEAIAQLQQALTLARNMTNIAQNAKTTAGDTASQQALNKTLHNLKAAGIVVSAPEGIGLVSPKAIRLASGGESVAVISGGNTDVSSGKSFTVSASDSVSLFAQSGGMQIFAGNGKLDIQSQANALNVSAQKDVTITSSEGKITVNASQELVLICGGAYIKLNGGNIELGAPGNILLNAANVQKMGASNLNAPLPTFPKGYGAGYAVKSLRTGELMPFTTYRITTAEGDVFEGISGPDSKTTSIYTSAPSQLKIEFPRNKTDSKEVE